MPFSPETTDEHLCELVQKGQRDAEETLVLRYNRLVRACARPLFLVGGDSEDLIQEGVVGLLTAIREYDATKGASFQTFAGICIRSRLYTVIRNQNLDKHSALNRSIPLETPFFDGNSYSLNLPSLSQGNPEDLFIRKENFSEILRDVHKYLSAFETKILGQYLQGLSYQEIAANMNKSPKSVDNAVQRIRRKVAQRIFPGDVSGS